MFRKKDTDSEGSTGGEGVLRRSVGEGAPTELPPRKVDLSGSGAERRRLVPAAGCLRASRPSRISSAASV